MKPFRENPSAERIRTVLRMLAVFVLVLSVQHLVPSWTLTGSLIAGLLMVVADAPRIRSVFKGFWEPLPSYSSAIATIPWAIVMLVLLIACVPGIAPSKLHWMATLSFFGVTYLAAGFGYLCLLDRRTERSAYRLNPWVGCRKHTPRPSPSLPSLERLAKPEVSHPHPALPQGGGT